MPRSARARHGRTRGALLATHHCVLFRSNDSGDMVSNTLEQMANTNGGTPTASTFFDSRGLGTSVFGVEVAHASLRFFPARDLPFATHHALLLAPLSAHHLPQLFPQLFARARSKAPALSKSTGTSARRRPRAARSSSPAPRWATSSPHARAPCAELSGQRRAVETRTHPEDGERPRATGQSITAQARSEHVHSERVVCGSCACATTRSPRATGRETPHQSHG